MRQNDLRLFVPVLLAWAATAACLAIPAHAYTVALTCAVASLVLWVFVTVGLRLRTAHSRDSIAEVLSVLLLFAFALTSVLAVRVGFEHGLREPATLRSALEQGGSILWQGVATSGAEEPPGSQSWSDRKQFTATVNSFTVQGKRYRASIPVRVSAPSAEADQIMIGSTLAFTGNAKVMPSAASVTYSVGATHLRVTEPHGVLRATHHLRHTLRDAADAHDGWGAQLVPGLAVGDTTLVTAELDTAMKNASLSHLTAVSGANCAIITGIVLTAGRTLRLRRAVRIAFAVLFLAMFVTLVTPEPSVLRAAVMSSVTMIATLTARKGAGVATLALAILVLLILDPWQAQHLGFVLSVFATAGIILFTEPIVHWLRRWMPNWLALVFAVPIAAQLVCQPAIILMQPTLPTYGVVANVLAAPAAPLATVLGLLACLLLPMLPWLGEFAVLLSWWPASWIAHIAEVTDSLPAAQLPWLPGWVGALLLATIVATVLVALYGRKGVQRQSVYTARWIAASLAVSLLVAIAIVRPVTVMALLPPHWRIFACDVGQGDAVLIRGNAGIMLIDTGIDPKLIDECLDLLAISRIDVLVLTHDDKDHVGGVSGVIERVETAIVSPSPEPSRPVVDVLQAARVETVIGDRGMHGRLGDVHWQILWPAPGKKVASTNDASLIVRVNAPELSALFLGDLGEQAQRALMRTTKLEPVDIVKVAHHGSADQSSELYQTLSASYGIISVGAKNGYGHPTTKLLDVLRRTETLPLRTDTQGALAIARDADGKWRLWGRSPVG